MGDLGAVFILSNISHAPDHQMSEHPLVKCEQTDREIATDPA